MVHELSFERNNYLRFKRFYLFFAQTSIEGPNTIFPFDIIETALKVKKAAFLMKLIVPFPNLGNALYGSPQVGLPFLISTCKKPDCFKSFSKHDFE